MRFSRTWCAVIALLVVGFLGASGPARTGTALAVSGSPPVFMTWLEYSTQTFHISATNGMPGAPGLFNVLVVTGPNPGLIQLPFTYDAKGNAVAVFPITPLINGMDCLVALNCVSTGTDGELHESGVWALATRNYVVNDPNEPPCNSCPTAPGGWLDLIEWPGAAGGPLYPHSLIAISLAEERESGAPMLALESGPAGSFPIN
jgi:hypothetical protein